MAKLQDTFGDIGLPSQLTSAGFDPAANRGADNINRLLDNIVGIFFAAAAIAFIIMFVWGAVQMILSAGDKEAISKARGKITWAIVGITLLGLSYFIFQLLQAITGFQFFLP
jgi:hypothetical protein